MRTQDGWYFRKGQEEGTFRETAENWFKRHVQANALRSEPEIRRCLDRYVYPDWEDRSFLELRRGDVTDLLDGIEDKSGQRQADMVLAVIRSIMQWYQSRHDDYVCPVVRGMRRSKTVKRKRILSDDEIRALFAACDDIDKIGGAFVKMLLFTAQRRGKLVKMRWHDVKDGQWHIPSSPREKGTAGLVPLPKPALDLIKAQPRLAKNPYVFPGSAVGRRFGETQGPPHFNSFSQRKAELDAKMRASLGTIEPWTFHDLRRTARSLMSRAGVSSDHAERTLGHEIKGVEGVYDRHAYTNEKGEALNKLAQLIELILQGPQKNNVVEMRRRKS